MADQVNGHVVVNAGLYIGHFFWQAFTYSVSHRDSPTESEVAGLHLLIRRQSSQRVSKWVKPGNGGVSGRSKVSDPIPSE